MRTRRVAVAALAAFVPIVLIGNGVHALAHPWFPRWEIHRLAPEPYGLTQEQRIHLADVALDSIVPWGGGDRVLREARLPNGTPAFDPKERRHLTVVRHYVLGLYALHAAALLAFLGLALVRRTRPILRDGLAAGALFTLGITAFVGVYLAVAPISFLGGFHRVFFSGASWRFAETETLRRVFPDAFWTATAVVLGALVALQAVLLLVAAQGWRKQANRRRARTTPHARS